MYRDWMDFVSHWRVMGTRSSLTSDFRFFSPKEYLTEYYSAIGPENAMILRFHVEAYRCMFLEMTQAHILELGGGPTVYQCIAAAKYPVTIDFAEFLDGNRKEVDDWVHKNAYSFNWDSFISYVLQVEKCPTTTVAVRQRAASVRRSICRIFPCDLLHDTQNKVTNAYDIVSSHFVAESITGSRRTWRQIIHRIVSHVLPNKYLVLGSIIGALQYRVGTSYFPATPITVKDIVDLLLRESCVIRFSRYEIAEDPSQGYAGLSMILAQKISIR